MHFVSVIHPLHPRTVFRLSRAQRTEVRNVFVRVEQEGWIGHGEASPNAFYAETAENVNAKLQHAAVWLRGRTVRCVADIARVWEEIWPLVQPSRAAQCALDVALWDLVAQQAGVSVAELSFGEKPRPVTSFVTIGLSTPVELAEKVAELAAFPFIKIKMDATADLETVRFIRARTGARLAADANCAWRGLDVAALSRELAALGVEFIEQPLPPADHEKMQDTLAQSALPIIADESCVTSEDVERLVGHFSGFNIKLVKCGGLTPALAMLQRGHALGLHTMVGCMLESSALIAAGAVVAQQTAWADLDGAWLLRDDPWAGWSFQNGTLDPPRAAGLGLAPQPDLFV